MVKDPEHVSGVNPGHRQTLGDTPVRVVDWTQSNDSFFAAVTVEQIVMFLILTLIIVVAAFNVVSSLYHDGEGQERAIRRVAHSVGASPRRHHAHLPCVQRPPMGVTGTVAGTADRRSVLPE